LSPDAPRYEPALATVTACCALGIVILAIIWFLNIRENRRRAAIVSAPGYVLSPDQAFSDLTDR
jgi:ACS family allantoate permease-like MFS transporter